MSFGETVKRRGEQAAAARQSRLAGQIAASLEAIEGVEVQAGADEVAVQGRALLQRWLSDARLRFAGRVR